MGVSQSMSYQGYFWGTAGAGVGQRPWAYLVVPTWQSIVHMSCFIHAIKVEREFQLWCSLVPPALGRVPAEPCPFERYSGVSKYISFSSPVVIFLLCPRTGEYTWATQLYPFLLQAVLSRVRFPSLWVSICLPFSMGSLYCFPNVLIENYCRHSS